MAGFVFRHSSAAEHDLRGKHAVLIPKGVEEDLLAEVQRLRAEVEYLGCI